jgi:hypothetical protein
MKLKIALHLLIVTMLIACGDDDPSGPDTATVAGTYTLRTVNGQDLPFTIINQTGYKLEVLSDEYTLNPNGSFTTVATFRETEGTDVTTSSDTYSGTWQVNGSNVSLTSTVAGIETAAFSGGNTMTFSGNGVSAVYRK